MNIANRSVDEQIKESEPNEIDTLCVILVNSILTMMSHAPDGPSEIGTDKVTLIINDEVNREVALYEVRNTKKVVTTIILVVIRSVQRKKAIKNSII